MFNISVIEGGLARNGGKMKDSAVTSTRLLMVISSQGQ
jgi:hypothetical protein